MKRFLSLLLAAVLLLALAACGGNVKDVQTKALSARTAVRGSTSITGIKARK